MNYQPQTLMGAIKNRLSILEIVKRYVAIRQVGNRWVAPCPFHQESKPSFSVNEEEGFFYCFGCQAAGDIFDFYSRINGLDFKEALAQLAEEAGVSLQHTGKSQDHEKKRNLRALAYQLYEHATFFYQKNLSSPQGDSCRKYLEERALAQEMCAAFELGWSLSSWQGLADFLQKRKFSLEAAEAVGLVIKSDRGNYYDRFRSRLIFPIKDLSGKTIAFGGRVIAQEDTAKYINSSDSPIYKKGDNLYGLFQARRSIAATSSVILTEGYMDVLTLHQFGYTNACGILGTALTQEQVRRLSGFTSSLELLFDGDGPGRKAALRACELILAKGLRCRVIAMPEGEDIDNFLKKYGNDAFAELRKYAPDGLDFCIRALSAQYAPKEALAWVESFLQSVEHVEFLPSLISRLCQGLDLDERTLRRKFADKSPDLKKHGRRTDSQKISPLAVVQKNALDREFLKFVARFPHHAGFLDQKGLSFILTETWAHTLWAKVLACAPKYDAELIASRLDPSEKEFWVQSRLVNAPPAEFEQDELEDVCASIVRLCLEKEKNACLQALRQNSSNGNNDLTLLKALNDTVVRKRTLGSVDE